MNSRGAFGGSVLPQITSVAEAASHDLDAFRSAVDARAHLHRPQTGLHLNPHLSRTLPCARFTLAPASTLTHLGRGVPIRAKRLSARSSYRTAGRVHGWCDRFEMVGVDAGAMRARRTTSALGHVMASVVDMHTGRYRTVGKFVSRAMRVHLSVIPSDPDVTVLAGVRQRPASRGIVKAETREQCIVHRPIILRICCNGTKPKPPWPRPEDTK